jgi:hypothetical protein
MFVFDVSDTEPIPGAPEIPIEVEKPFEVSSGMVGRELDRTILNAIRDGIEITQRKEGAQSAGSIEKTSEKEPKTLSFPPGRDEDGNQIFEPIPRRYSLLLNETLSREARYASLAHELGHLYCGHLGTPNHNWWPDRGRLEEVVAEFEAEAVAYLVCRRLGIGIPSDRYLSEYLGRNGEIPPISPENVMRSAGLVEQMGREKMGVRKKR